MFQNSIQKTTRLIAFVLIATSCSGQTNQGKPEVNPITIQQKFMDWWTYQSKNIMLSRDFTALDTHSNKITKENFLEELSSGKHIPIRMESKDVSVYYKLFKIETTSDSSIRATIVATAVEEYEHFKMEGTTFPAFSFTDLNGTVYTNETVKEKIVVIKCWYIHCTACVKEFPLVNKLTEEYKDRKDIVFISLAEDSPEQLKSFLTKKPLAYPVVANQKNYMNEVLHLNAFPTHFIINKQGKIAKVLLNYEGLELALKKESNL